MWIMFSTLVDVVGGDNVAALNFLLIHIHQEPLYSLCKPSNVIEKPWL